MAVVRNYLKVNPRGALTVCKQKYYICRRNILRSYERCNRYGSGIVLGIFCGLKQFPIWMLTALLPALVSYPYPYPCWLFANTLRRCVWHNSLQGSLL